ncbi:M20 aminoacylase family protein [Nitrosomonas sp. Is35]|uniref:M20 aminoacylase family protein n=1 Tax=Nitrosomonas sp. Is35 TaxID=3080534 RepID=UPI00294AD521|nr:M20 aminoacylase family protein [Nitrosomonas sp. Is35]MDV6346065.1 M20 aminoacylase family protein [Nitrosomonas sp. Is35]
MNIAPEIQALQADMQRWRRHIHQHPETAFEETATARLIADLLQQAGIEVHQGLAKTGIVGVLRRGNSSKSIALRADMDALRIQEQNRFDHASCHSGKMHACGHDGHCAMLLGAASYLAKHGRFDGTVYFIFQPAEECRAGAHQMISEGLFEQFPAQRFGMHNFPDVPAGHFAVKTGPMMASFDCFEITLQGQATHAAMPHLGNDVLVAAAHLITQLQTIVSRQIDPADAAVVSVTQIHGGNTWNALPDSAVIRGTFRSFKNSVREQLEQGIRHLADSVAQGFGIHAKILFNPENPGYPVTINSPEETASAIRAAIAVAGEQCVDTAPTASMGAEDFAFMLQQKPGCYIWIGNGSSGGGCLLHNPHYDFNDEILPLGAAYWVKLVENELPG